MMVAERQCRYDVRKAICHRQQRCTHENRQHWTERTEQIGLCHAPTLLTNGKIASPGEGRGREGKVKGMREREQMRRREGQWCLDPGKIARTDRSRDDRRHSQLMMGGEKRAADDQKDWEGGGVGFLFSLRWSWMIGREVSGCQRWRWAIGGLSGPRSGEISTPSQIEKKRTGRRSWMRNEERFDNYVQEEGLRINDEKG